MERCTLATHSPRQRPSFTVGFMRMLGKTVLFLMGFHYTSTPISAPALTSWPTRSPCSVRTSTACPICPKSARGRDPVHGEEEQGRRQVGQHQVSVPDHAVSRNSNAAHPPLRRHQVLDAVPAATLPTGPLRPGLPDRLAEVHSHHRRQPLLRYLRPLADNSLKELHKIKFGRRYTVYSPKDGQP